MLLLCTPIFADELANQLADFSNGLAADIAVQDAPLVQSPQIVTVTISADNPQGEAMPLYVLRQDVASDGTKQWEVVKLIGALAPMNRTTVQLDIELTYPKETHRNTRYAIVGRASDGQLYGSYFEINEDWSQYERNINDNLSAAIATYVPILGGLLIILLIIMVQVAYSSKSKGVLPGEYTMKTLIFPEVEGRPFEEKIADLMINPILIAFELACVGVLAFVMFDNVTRASGFDQGVKILVLSGIGAITIPFIYLAAAWYFEKREEGKPLRFFTGMFVWGMFAAFMSLLVSSSIISEMTAVDSASYALIATMLIAPIVEETFKGLGVLFMSGHHEFNDALTGMLLGFACGVGFAFVENWFYFSTKVIPFDIGFFAWVQLILYRSFFNTMAHGCFTAIAGTIIGYLRSIERLKKFARIAFVPGIFLAIVIHSIFNLSAIADSVAIASRQVMFFIFNPMLIILLSAMFFLVLVFATIDEKKRKLAKKPMPRFDPPVQVGGGWQGQQ
ncbi:Protease prsW family protein [uncultured archaeon]|nr:Protease prsW family protein [uncultured archaeon]